MSDPSETTQAKHSGLIPWQPGQSGNPAGRPKGSKHKLGEAFVEALHADFQLHGAKAIIDAREESPVQYLKVIASVVPKDINLNINNDEMSDDELVERIRELDAAIAPFLADRENKAGGVCESAAGEALAARVH